jgi:hypothetical protein
LPDRDLIYIDTLQVKTVMFDLVWHFYYEFV